MAGFGLGAMNGFINTYSGLKQLDQRDRQLDQAETRMARDQSRLDQNMDLRKKEEARAAYNFQRQKDLQNMNMLTATIANGQDIGEDGWKLYQDTQTRMPMFSEVGRQSPAMDAALKVLQSAGPESVNDPAAVSALSSVLTMGADPGFIKKLSLSKDKPGVVIAEGKDGIAKEYSLADLENHVSYAGRMRAVSKSPQFLSGIKKLREAYGFDKKATAVFKEIYNDKGQKQLARLDPESGELLGYVGGAKPISPNKTGKKPDYVKTAVDLLKSDDAYQMADEPTKKRMLLDAISTVKQGYGLQTADGGGKPVMADIRTQAIQAIQNGADAEAVAARLEDKDPEGAALIRQRVQQATVQNNRYVKRLERNHQPSESERLAAAVARDDVAAVGKLVKQYVSRGEVLPAGLARAQLKRLKATGIDTPEVQELMTFLSKYAQ